jgi:hypothetical protein
MTLPAARIRVERGQGIRHQLRVADVALQTLPEIGMRRDGHIRTESL